MSEERTCQRADQQKVKKSMPARNWESYSLKKDLRWSSLPKVLDYYLLNQMHEKEVALENYYNSKT